MRYLLSLLVALSITATAAAQYNWCVSLRGNIKLKHVGEDRIKNVVVLSATELNTPGSFRINFDKTDTAMRRTVFVSDPSGNTLRTGEEVKRTWRIRTSDLKKMIEEKGELSFFYTEIPRDANQAMLVKIRPVHLCTLKGTTH